MILLNTKLYIPSLKSRIVNCQRLIQKLQKGIHGKLTLVSAPTGFGKTTLVCQWIDQQKVPVAWYSLDGDDNESDVFFRYLLAALQTLGNDMKSAFDPLLQGQQIPVVGEILVRIINHLSSLSKKIYLVLDDYHLIHSKTIHNAMFYLLQNSPPQLHIFIITRHDPPLPLARFRARQEMTVIRAADLKLREQETAQFFKEVMQFDLSPRQVHELYSITEGWIIGLQIAGLSLQKSDSFDQMTTNFSAQNKYLLDYLLEEVLDRQPKEIQEFLLKTSILKQLHIDLCCEVTGNCDTVDMLEQLERSNLFIIPLDSRREWYRYHHLFAELLLHRLKYSETESTEVLHQKASLWYAKKGYLEEAFHHGFSSKDFDFAADLLENHLLSLLADYEWTTARRWLEKMPGEIIQQRFLLMLYHAWIIFLQEEFDKLDTILTSLEKCLDQKTKRYPDVKRKYAQDMFLALKVYCLFYKDQSVQTLPLAKDALQSISPRNIAARWLVQAVLSTAYAKKGDIHRAFELVQSALSTFKNLDTKENAFFVVHLLNKQADLKRLQGRLRSAEKMLKDAFEYAQQEGFTIRPAMAEFNITLARIYYSQNRLESALDHAAKCIEYAKPASDIGFLLLGYQMEAFIREILGESKLAKETMQEAVLLAQQTKSAVRIASTELAAVQLALMQSDLEAVCKWSKRRNLSFCEPFSHDFEKECIILARFHLAKHRYQESAELLKALRPRAQKRKRFGSALEIDTALAAALYALGEREAALLIMEGAVEFASLEGYIRPFADIAAYISKILFALRKSKNGPVRIYVPKLLKVCELERGSHFAGKRLAVSDVETLTPREVEILKLIATGLTNKEIADHKFISPNTIKTHIRNIYGKLGVTNREQAIMRAKELDFFNG